MSCLNNLFISHMKLLALAPLVYEVVLVILSCVVFEVWIGYVVSPAHHLAVVNSRINRWESHLEVVTFGVEWIAASTGPLHQGAFVS